METIEDKMKVAIILGTRPEIIKMSPIIRELEDRKLDYFILHTGQHYSYNMDEVFFEQLRLQRPKYNLKVGFGTHAEETGKMLIGIEKILQNERPDVILVEGDTNTVLAGALASSKLMIKVGHVEAGLRSFDRTMPEEINRILTDHLSEYLFAPTEVSKQNLIAEGIDREKIFVTGNTIVDAVYQNLELARNHISQTVPVNENGYFLATLHRQENVDNEDRLKDIVNGLELVSEKLDKTIIYPIHPRSKKRFKEYGISINSGNIKIVGPVDYLTFLKLESEAELILTDSGGVQEEACILNVPCVTIRDSTERPETIQVGANILSGTNPISILDKTVMMVGRKRNWPNPYGTGNASKEIIKIISTKQ